MRQSSVQMLESRSGVCLVTCCMVTESACTPTMPRQTLTLTPLTLTLILTPPQTHARIPTPVTPPCTTVEPQQENPGPEEASLPGMDGGNGSHGLDRSGRSHSAAPAACAVPPALPEAAAEVPPAAASRAGSGIAHPPGGGGGSRRAQGGYAAFMRDSLGDAPPAAEGSVHQDPGARARLLF